jgi:hypothetical protein
MNSSSNPAENLTDYEKNLLGNIPSADQYPSADARQAIELLKGLPEKKQLEVLKRLGVTPENPLSISGQMKFKLLSVLAEVKFNVDTESKGRSGVEISTPTGGASRRKK